MEACSVDAPKHSPIGHLVPSLPIKEDLFLVRFRQECDLLSPVSILPWLSAVFYQNLVCWLESLSARWELRHGLRAVVDEERAYAP